MQSPPRRARGTASSLRTRRSSLTCSSAKIRRQRGSPQVRLEREGLVGQEVAHRRKLRLATKTGSAQKEGETPIAVFEVGARQIGTQASADRSAVVPNGVASGARGSAV